MQFTIEQTLHATPSDVQDMLLDPAFLAARAQLPKLGDSEVLERTQDATSAHLRVRMRFVGELSSAVTAVVDPAKLTWVDEATFDFAAHTGRHEIIPDHYPDRLSATYDDTVTTNGDGSRRELRGELSVRVPIVGGRVERVIVEGLQEYAAAEAELLNDCLRRA
jgi:Protein of unknown function (DUF2505)